MISLTPRQSDLFGFIQFMISEHGIAPSYDEMKGALGVTGQGLIEMLLDKLEERGRIRRRRGVRRGIDVLAYMADGTPLKFIPTPAQPHEACGVVPASGGHLSRNVLAGGVVGAPTLTDENIFRHRTLVPFPADSRSRCEAGPPEGASAEREGGVHNSRANGPEFGTNGKD